MTPAGSVPGRAATYLATQPRNESSSRRGGPKAGSRALTCLAFSSGSAVPLSITRGSCPNVTLRQLCLLCNPSLLAYRPANVAKKGTGKKKKKKPLSKDPICCSICSNTLAIQKIFSVNMPWAFADPCMARYVTVEAPILFNLVSQ